VRYKQLAMKRIIQLLAAALLVTAQVTIPDTPAGRQFSHWLETFNRGDPAGLKELQTRFVKPDDAERDKNFREMTGGFNLEKIEESTGTRIAGIVQERADANHHARFTMEVEAAEPHRITNFGLLLIQDGGPPPARMTEKDAIGAMQAEIDKRVKDDRFSGAVLIAKNGKTVFSGAYGMADREKKIPNQLDTQFRIGSMNKMFTATATMQLVEAGKLELQTPIGKYLSDYPNKEIASKVTVHHLLTHTGGTGDFFGPEFKTNRLQLKDLKDYVALFGNRGPKFEPGSKFEYSNYGFLLLGVIVERVSGQSYYDYVRAHVFKPAGMTRTDSLPETESVPGRSVGYMRVNGAWKPNVDTLPVRGTSAGGGYSTVEDLSRFASAILTHKELNARNTEILTTGKVAMGPVAKYAYGFGDVTRNGVREFGHNGGAPGMNGELKVYPQSGYVVVVLANVDPPAAGQIADFISSRLPL
jgi:D-alanyl-D-alanine carboxypeptidase